MKTSTVQYTKTHFTRYQTLLLGNGYFCNNFYRKAVNFRTLTQENVKKDNILYEASYKNNDIKKLIETLKQNFQFLKHLKLG